MTPPAAGGPVAGSRAYDLPWVAMPHAEIPTTPRSPGWRAELRSIEQRRLRGEKSPHDPGRARVLRYMVDRYPGTIGRGVPAPPPPPTFAAKTRTPPPSRADAHHPRRIAVALLRLHALATLPPEPSVPRDLIALLVPTAAASAMIAALILAASS